MPSRPMFERRNPISARDKWAVAPAQRKVAATTQRQPRPGRPQKRPPSSWSWPWPTRTKTARKMSIARRRAVASRRRHRLLPHLVQSRNKHQLRTRTAPSKEPSRRPKPVGKKRLLRPYPINPWGSLEPAQAWSRKTARAATLGRVTTQRQYKTAPRLATRWTVTAAVVNLPRLRQSPRQLVAMKSQQRRFQARAGKPATMVRPKRTEATLARL